jgi:hypothetical protein
MSTADKETKSVLRVLRGLELRRLMWGSFGTYLGLIHAGHELVLAADKISGPSVLDGFLGKFSTCLRPGGVSGSAR